MITSCQSLPKKSIEISEKEEVFFKSCQHKNGSGSFELLKEDHRIFRSDFEWVTDHLSVLRAELVTPLGNSSLKIKCSDESFAVTGPSAKIFKAPQKSQSGKLLYDGYWSGLYSDEFCYFFTGDIPARWRNTIYKKQKSLNQVEYFVEDKKRQIKITDRYNSSQQEVSSRCISLSWSHFWIFFRSNLQWCTYFSPNKKVTEFEFEGKKMARFLHDM